MPRLIEPMVMLMISRLSPAKPIAPSTQISGKIFIQIAIIASLSEAKISQNVAKNASKTKPRLFI